MVILHICSITNNFTSGISNVVPEYYLHQKKIFDVGLLNCNNIILDKLKNEKNVFYYNKIKKGKISCLPEPYCKPDLVVFHGIYIVKYIKLSRELVRLKIPYIIIPHGSLTYMAQHIKYLKKKIFNFLLFNEYIYNAAKIQYLSSTEYSTSYLFKVNCFVCGNGINISRISKQNFSKKGLKVIYVGRYAVFTKGLDIILKCISQNKNFFQNNNVKFVFYGSGGDGKNRIINMVKDMLIDNIVEINDAIFDSQKEKLILSSDFFIQLSRHEGQPLGIIEAMSLGMPVIVSDGSTFGDVVKANNCGYVANNPQELLNVFCEVIHFRQRLSKCSQNSRKYAIDNFSWDVILDKTINEYEKILRELN